MSPTYLHGTISVFRILLKRFIVALHTQEGIAHRLKREGYVEGVEVNNKGLYSITPKGQKLLRGWVAFLTAYS